MDEAERLADRIAVIVAGRIVAEGTPHTLGGQRPRTAPRSASPPPALAPTELPGGPRARRSPRRPAASRSRATPRSLTSNRSPPGRATNRAELSDLEVTRPTLEDIYLQLTNNDKKELQTC